MYLLLFDWAKQFASGACCSTWIWVAVGGSRFWSSQKTKLQPAGGAPACLCSRVGVGGLVLPLPCQKASELVGF